MVIKGVYTGVYTGIIYDGFTQSHIASTYVDQKWVMFVTIITAPQSLGHIVFKGYK